MTAQACLAFAIFKVHLVNQVEKHVQFVFEKKENKKHNP